MSISSGLPLGVKERYLWLRRLVAVLIVLNLGLVFFDLTYLSARSLYLQYLPSLVEKYDPIKGVRPHPLTQRYLEQVDALAAQLAETDVRSPAVAATLEALRTDSQRLIQTNPFPETDSAVLETIQEELRSRTGTASTSLALERLWSQDYLAEAGWQSELEFWNQEIRPLIAANYYRRVNRYGYPTDYFWLIDLPFVLIFALDFLIRLVNIRRRHPELSGLEAILRRWYDLFLLLPFWRWLRVIPAIVRLHQVRLINLAPVQAEARRDFAIGFAKQLTELVGIRTIDLIQSAIRRGDVMRWLLYPESRRPYLQVNEQNEVEAIATRITDIILQKVIPQIQPELEAFIHHSFQNAIVEELPGYRLLKQAPLIGQLPSQTAERLTQDISKRMYHGLLRIWNDPSTPEITETLIQRFRNTLAMELQKKQNTQEIEDLLVDMLEEIKINYVRGISEAELEAIVNEVERLQRQR